jgi:hypothetical protein
MIIYPTFEQDKRNRKIFTHVMVGSKDLDAFRRCYDALFAAIGGNPAGNKLSGRRKAA